MFAIVRSGWPKLLLIALLIASVGGHRVVIQGVAWGAMIVRYAESDPLPQALAKTFDGKHPCGICVWVTQGEQKSQRPAMRPWNAKIDFFCETRVLTIAQPEVADLPRIATLALDSRVDQPRVPPPRAA